MIVSAQTLDALRRTKTLVRQPFVWILNGKSDQHVKQSKFTFQYENERKFNQRSSNKNSCRITLVSALCNRHGSRILFAYLVAFVRSFSFESAFLSTLRFLLTMFTCFSFCGCTLLNFFKAPKSWNTRSVSGWKK